MKSKFDAPHLEPLRYDYQLLHDAYANRDYRSVGLIVVQMVVGWSLFIIGVVGLLFNALN